MRSFSRRWAAVTASVTVIGCGDGAERASESADNGNPPTVYVVNYPLEYFATRIGAGVVSVEFPMAGDGDPAFWQPDAETIRALQQADLILLNGADYAKWVPQVTLPERRLINTSASFADRYLRVAGVVTHTHGPEGEHSHEGTAFTTWLDATLAIQQADAIRQAFSSRWPAHREGFEANFDNLRADLESVDGAMTTVAAAFAGIPIVASHPVYQYLAHRYDLDIESVMWEPDVMPSAADWRELQRLLGRHPATIMLWEGEPLAETGMRLRELGLEPVVFDPTANRPDEGDYLTVATANVNSLRNIVANW